MTTQIRYPKGDDTSNWAIYPISSNTRWDKVDDPASTPNDNKDYIYATSTNDQTFTFSPFTIPTNSIINKLTIYYRYKKRGNSTPCNIRSVLKVGNSYYNNIDNGVNPTTSWKNISYSYTINPKTGQAWTVADINGISTNPLQAFGVYSSDAYPNPYCTQCYAIVDYTIDYTIRYLSLFLADFIIPIKGDTGMRTVISSTSGINNGLLFALKPQTIYGGI